MLSAKACYVTNRDIAPYAKADVENLGVRLFRPEDHPRIAHFDTSWETFKQIPKEDWNGFVLEVNGELVAAAWFHRHYFSPEPWR